MNKRAALFGKSGLLALGLCFPIPPGHLTGAITLSNGSQANQLRTAPDCTYLDSCGEIALDMVLSGTQWIYQDGTSLRLVSVPFDSLGQYVEVLLADGEPSTCYRARLYCHSEDGLQDEWGSARVCLPDPDPTTVPPSSGDDKSCIEGDPDCVSPIVIDTEGDGFRFSDTVDPVPFDIDADGETELISWTRGALDDAFLVLDRNGNGTIDDGSELFGTNADQPSSDHPNGYLALAMFDRSENGGNDDGLISGSDSVFQLLRLWYDKNHNGVSETSELEPLGQANITSIELGYIESMRRDKFSNRLRYASYVHFGQQRRLASVDVFFRLAH